MVDLYLITGFLGAGKTTFIQNILSNFKNDKVALVINEFADKSIDGTIFSEKNITLKEINNGSILCQCKADTFIKSLVYLKEKGMNTIIIEGSGLIDPSGMTKIMEVLNNISSNSFNHKSTICLVDCKNFYDALDSFKLVENQLIYSNLIILNKIDALLK